MPPNGITYNTAIRACGDAGALDEALGLMDEMVEKGVKVTVVTYGTAISACQKRGDWRTVSDPIVERRHRFTVFFLGPGGGGRDAGCLKEDV